MPKKPQEQFTDDEMEQMKRYGSAQLGGTDFSEQVEKELDKLQANREASANKMKAALTGGLGPSDMDQAQIKQRGAIDEQADTQAAAQAQQAQGAQTPVNAPPAPSGPAGTTTAFPAQQGAVGGGGNAQQPAQQQPQPQPPPPSGPPPGPPQEDEGEDPSTQFPP